MVRFQKIMNSLRKIWKSIWSLLINVSAYRNDTESKAKNKKIHVHEINFGKADGAIIHHRVHRGKIIKKLAHIAGEKKKVENSTSKKKDDKLKNLNRRAKKLNKEKTKVEDKILALENVIALTTL